MRRHAIALSMAGLLLLALGAQAPATPAGRDTPGPQAVADATQSAQAATSASRQVDDETARLRAALAAARPFTAPSRNPFSFHQPVARATPRVTAPAARDVPEPPAAPRPAAPEVPVLVAIVGDSRTGGVTRTAMLSFDGETAIVGIGDTFVRFRVLGITDTTVALGDLTSPAHAVLTLSIR